MPLVGFDPVQFGFAGIDEAVQAVAFVDVHESADEAPYAMEVGLAVSETVGTGGHATEVAPVVRSDGKESPAEFEAMT